MSNQTVYMKFVIIGDGSVGKTSMLLTYVRKGFPTEYEPTVMDNYQVEVPLRNQTVNCDVWDTAGQETFGGIRYLSYQNTDIFLVCYGCDSKTSFNNVKNSWIPEMRKEAKDVPFVLVGTKLDLVLPPNRPMQVVSNQDAALLCKELKGNGYFQCSAIQNRGVEEVFKGCIKIVFDLRNSSTGPGGCCPCF
eukprot:maker-scaffold_5-snap-gene-12.56-mRNA-1 protein AED:0.02 eAED:0.02 QI:502/1/1/1/1/1/3/93/190